MLPEEEVEELQLSLNRLPEIFSMHYEVSYLMLLVVRKWFIKRWSKYILVIKDSSDRKHHVNLGVYALTEVH